MMDRDMRALDYAALENAHVRYVEDRTLFVGDERAQSDWRVVLRDPEMTPQQKVAQLKAAEQTAEPLLSNLTEIQEVRRSLANLWVELCLPTQVETVRSLAGSVGQVAAAEVVSSKLMPDIATKRQARTELIKARPRWESYFPAKDDLAGEAEYEVFLSSLPEGVREHVSYLRHLVEQRNSLWTNDKIRTAYQCLQPERYIANHNASVYGYYQRQAEAATKKISDTRVEVHRRGRSMDVVEEKRITRLEELSHTALTRSRQAVTDLWVTAEVDRRADVKRATQLKNGFMETPKMHSIIEVVVPRLAEGLPAAFFGEVGGAKSALARHLARRYLNNEPIQVDCGPDITMQTLFTATKLRVNGNGAETYEQVGSITRAAEEGRTLIMDEYDTLPARIRTACNGALLWRVGQTVRPAGLDRDIVVKPGFCIIITANLRSNRYDREKLDLSTIDRFEPNGAGIFEIHYPDNEIVPGAETPPENFKLAMAALTDERGDIRMPPGMIEPGSANNDPKKRITEFVKAAHTIQRFFSDSSAIVGFESLIPDSQHLARSRNQGKPVLEQAVLSPRGMLGILRNLQISGTTTSLSKELARWVGNQPVEMDRKIIATILASRGLLVGMRERDMKIPEGTLSRFYSSVPASGTSGRP